MTLHDDMHISLKLTQGFKLITFYRSLDNQTLRLLSQHFEKHSYFGT